MLPPSLEYVKNMKPRQLLEAFKTFKGAQGGQRVTMSDKGGMSISQGGTMPNSSITRRVGTNDGGSFDRITTGLRRLGSFNQTQRKTTFSSEPNTTSHVNRIVGSSSNPRPSIRHNFRSSGGGGGGRTRRSRSDTANMLHDVSKWVQRKTPNFIKRIASKGFNSI